MAAESPAMAIWNTFDDHQKDILIAAAQVGGVTTLVTTDEDVDIFMQFARQDALQDIPEIVQKMRKAKKGYVWLFGKKAEKPNGDIQVTMALIPKVKFDTDEGETALREFYTKYIYSETGVPLDGPEDD